MADARGGKDRPSSSAKNKVVRSQKISQNTSPIDPRHEQSEASTDDTRSNRAPPIPRSHTPGHLASKSQDRRHRPSELSIRQRSQSAAGGSLSLSASQATFSLPSSASTPKPLSATTSNGGGEDIGRPPTSAGSTPQRERNDSAGSGKDTSVNSLRRPTNLRSTSAIAARPGTANSPASGTQRGSAGGGAGNGSSAAGWSTRGAAARGAHTEFPPLADTKTAPDVPPAPSSGMYWSRAPVSGSPHTALRAHTTTLVGSNVYVFGGCDSRTCFNELYVLDADSFHWSTPHVVGDLPLPLRAMTCTTVGKKLVVFGGGDGPAYYNDVYVLDTVNFRWSRPRILGERAPSKRRAHTACLYKNGIYVFGGGDGIRALNDIWRLDVSDVNKMSWKLISGSSTASSSPPSSSDKSPGGVKDLRPKARGYHTANMVGSKLIIFGGSDGGECFNDVWVYDVESHIWKAVHIPITFRRLSHTANIVGSYLFVVGGHDGTEYSNDVLLLNLVTMTWDKRKVYGLPPSGRGYHGTVLHDSRLLVIGGFDGSEVFSDVWMLELAVHAYYSQISHFTIEV